MSSRNVVPRPNTGPHYDPEDQKPPSAVPESYVFSDQVGHLLRRAYQRHLAIFQRYASDPQLTSIQFVTLCALRDNGPSSQTEIVRATAVDQATIRPVVERLKARGLIALAPSQDDRRKVIADLTPQGRALLAEMVVRAHDITARTQARLNPAERVALHYLLQKLIDTDDEA